MARATPKTEAPAAVPLRRACGTMGEYQNLLEAYPSYRINVVVHILWNQATENISTAQIKSQIAVLNRDFTALNPDRSKTPTP